MRVSGSAWRGPATAGPRRRSGGCRRRRWPPRRCRPAGRAAGQAGPPAAVGALVVGEPVTAGRQPEAVAKPPAALGGRGGGERQPHPGRAEHSSSRWLAMRAGQRGGEEAGQVRGGGHQAGGGLVGEDEVGEGTAGGVMRAGGLLGPRPPEAAGGQTERLEHLGPHVVGERSAGELLDQQLGQAVAATRVPPASPGRLQQLDREAVARLPRQRGRDRRQRPVGDLAEVPCTDSPPVWLSSRRTVRPSALNSEGGGRQRRSRPRIGSSKPTRPASTSRSTPQAVTGLDSEAAWKRVGAVTGQQIVGSATP